DKDPSQGFVHACECSSTRQLPILNVHSNYKLDSLKFVGEQHLKKHLKMPYDLQKDIIPSEDIIQAAMNLFNFGKDNLQTFFLVVQLKTQIVEKESIPFQFYVFPYSSNRVLKRQAAN
ncbi:hypothetical protein STEG23_015996, partial [Scotinomys teguina]